MEVLDLARLQFAITTVYHFLFVPLTMGLSIIIAGMQTAYVRTGNEDYKRMTKFWGKLFLINFALGVVTGIVQEFQFGMNWSEYSRFVGDIFGAPLAVEALMAFFVESTFLGVWIFGWDKLPKRLHLGSIWLVAIGSNISAFWILVANSFMQNPVGFEIVGTRAEMTDFGALLTNPNVLLQFPHVFFSALTTAAFFVMGVSAFHLLRKTNNQWIFRRSFVIGAALGTITVFATMLAGHAQGQHMANTQPMKLAAAEGLYEDEDPAALSFFQVRSLDGEEEIVNLRIPSLLSFLTYNTPNGLVQGLNPLNEAYQEEFADRYGPDANYIPPVVLTYWSFRAMVGAGMAMFLLGLLGLWFNQRNILEKRGWFLRIAILAIGLPYLANSTGWLLTELGRQPWIVNGQMRIEEAVSPNVSVAELAISLIVFTLIYGLLAGVDVWMLWKFGSKGIEGDGGILPSPTPDSADQQQALEGAY